MSHAISRISVWSIVVASVRKFFAHKDTRLGAALAYYTVFSLPPLLVIVTALVGLIFGRELVQNKLLEQLSGLVGGESVEVFRTMIVQAGSEKTGLTATIIGAITLLLGASGVFGQLQDALNTVWEVRAKDSGGFLGMLKDRFLSFSMVLGLGFLFLVSLVISTGVTALVAMTHDLLPGSDFVIQLIDILVSITVVSAVCAAMFYYLPDAEVPLKHAIIGALVTSVLFSLGKIGIGIYLGRANVASPYGVAGSLVIILIWIYYSALIFLLGAEFTRAIPAQSGQEVVPTDKAEPAPEKARQ